MRERFGDLQIRKENLSLEVIENPDHFPEAVDQVIEKNNALELEMQTLRSKMFQVDQTITGFHRLHSVIENELMALAKNCHAFFTKMTESQAGSEVGCSVFCACVILERIAHADSFQLLDKESADLLVSVEIVTKYIPEETEHLRLAEHRIVKKKMVNANQMAVSKNVSNSFSILLLLCRYFHYHLFYIFNFLAISLTSSSTK